jgi:2'-5' RNA ligase
VTPGRTARLFLAIDLPAEISSAVTALFRELPAARWSNPDQLHLTLRFMAAVPEEEVAALGDALAALDAPRFSLALRGVGVFPGGGARRPPRVLWAGVTPEGPLFQVKAAIDRALGPDEEAAARGFRPHLTLARFREPPGPALAPYLTRHATFATPPFPVDEVVLYRSVLGAGGARHDVVRRCPLGP